MPAEIPTELPDFERMVSARFHETKVHEDDMGVVAGVMGVQPSHCNNALCPDKCPSVWLTVRLEGQTLDIRFDADVAVGLSALILHAAHVADPSLKEGAN